MLEDELLLSGRLTSEATPPPMLGYNRLSIGTFTCMEPSTRLGTKEKFMKALPPGELLPELSRWSISGGIYPGFLSDGSLMFAKLGRIDGLLPLSF